MDQDQQAPLPPRFSIRAKLLLVSVGILLLSAWPTLRWYEENFLGWSGDRAGRGVISSMATGTLPEGRDIVVVGGVLAKASHGYAVHVCCHDAESGKILWEQQGGNFGLHDLDDLQVWVAVDRHGDVFTTSAMQAPKMARLEKRTGADGRLLWSRDITHPGNFRRRGELLANHWLPPVVRGDGNLWVLGTAVGQTAGDPRLYLVNGQTGETMAHAPMEENQMPGIQFMDLMGLDGGGALLVYVKDNRPYIAHYSAAGTRIGGFAVTSMSGSLDWKELRVFVDERNQRVWFCEEEQRGGWSAAEWSSRGLVVSAYSLATGARLWSAGVMAEGEWGTPKGRIPDLFHLRPDGDLEVRHEFMEEVKKKDWLKWRVRKGLPMPRHKTIQRKRLLTTLVLGANGMHGDPVAMPKSVKNWFYLQAKQAGPSTQEERYNLSHFMHVGTVVRCRDSRHWLPVGTDAQGVPDMQCFRMVRTPSGRVVYARDPRDFIPYSRENLWQVRSPE